jgi:hypothetical protein
VAAALERSESMAWIFGPGFPGHPKIVEMEELKGFDVLKRAKAFKARTDAFFLSQVDVFQHKRLWAPFPLAVMTCIGIEMIGAYKYGDAAGDRNGHFKLFLKDMEPRFAELKAAPDNTQKELAAFVYQGFRNSMAHGFYGKWVFITHDSKKAVTFRYSAKKRFIVLNIYWFYKRFKEVAGQYFVDLLAAADPDREPLKTFNRTFEKNFALWTQ